MTEITAETDNGNGFNDLPLKLNRLQSGAALRVIDLFSGCGGLSLGFHRAGYNILAGIEHDAHAAESHGRNFFSHHDEEELAMHCQPRDITQLPPPLFADQMLSVNERANVVDIIIGGPPCQAFARIGRAKLREIAKHPEAYLNDHRASLYEDFLTYVVYFRPLAIVMENVPDIMNFGGTNVAEAIADELEGLGYNTRYTILNAVHYGVPQMRQRFFMIGILAPLGVTPTFPQPTHYAELPPGYESGIRAAMHTLPPLLRETETHWVDAPVPGQNLPDAITAWSALADLAPITAHLHGAALHGVRHFDVLAPYRPDITPSRYALKLRGWPGFPSRDGVYDHVIRTLPRDYPIFAAMRPGDQYPEAYGIACRKFAFALARELISRGDKNVDTESSFFVDLVEDMVPPYKVTKFPNKWRKMEANHPARTLTAHLGKDTYSHIHYDSRQARVISVREAARLQSFPDGFKFAGAMNPAFKAIGNAVPPLLAFAIAEHLGRLIMAANDCQPACCLAPAITVLPEAYGTIR